MKCQKREFLSGDIENLPGFLRIEVLDGEIYTDDWTMLEIDEDVQDTSNGKETYKIQTIYSGN